MISTLMRPPQGVTAFQATLGVMGVIFMVKLSSINMDALTIITSGGHGGNGGNGANGVAGEDGKDGSTSNPSETKSWVNPQERKKAGETTGVNMRERKCIMRIQALMGNVAAREVKVASVELVDRDSFILEGYPAWNHVSQDGQNGNVGFPGQGGIGGIHGRSCHGLIVNSWFHSDGREHGGALNGHTPYGSYWQSSISTPIALEAPRGRAPKGTGGMVNSANQQVPLQPVGIKY